MWGTAHTTGGNAIIGAVCYFHKNIDEKHKAGKILYQEWAFNINIMSFSQYGDKDTCHEMMAFHNEMEIEEDDQHNTWGLTRSWLYGSTGSKYVKLNNFYDQMDFDAG